MVQDSRQAGASTENGKVELAGRKPCRSTSREVCKGDAASQITGIKVKSLDAFGDADDSTPGKIPDARLEQITPLIGKPNDETTFQPLDLNFPDSVCEMISTSFESDKARLKGAAALLKRLELRY